MQDARQQKSSNPGRLINQLVCMYPLAFAYNMHVHMKQVRGWHRMAATGLGRRFRQYLAATAANECHAAQHCVFPRYSSQNGTGARIAGVPLELPSFSGPGPLSPLQPRRAGEAASPLIGPGPLCNRRGQANRRVIPSTPRNRNTKRQTVRGPKRERERETARDRGHFV